MTKTKGWTGWIVSALILPAFVPSAIMKIMQAPQAAEGMTRMGIPAAYIVPIGCIELLCVALFLIPRTTVLGAFLLTGYLGGATLANIIMGTDFIHALVIGLMVWTGAWLRVPQLRSLLPLVSSSRSIPAAQHNARQHELQTY